MARTRLFKTLPGLGREVQVLSHHVDSYKGKQIEVYEVVATIAYCDGRKMAVLHDNGKMKVKHTLSLENPNGRIAGVRQFIGKKEAAQDE